MITLTPALVTRAGHALYGKDWQMPLSRLLGVSDRTIRRIAQAARTGEAYTIPQGWLPELAKAVREAAIQHELRGREAEEVARLLEGEGEA